MPTNCQFALARNTPIYYSGEQISGTISVATTKPLKLSAIKLAFVGAARVEWLDNAKTLQCEQHDFTHADNTVHYQGQQSYIDESIRLAEHITLKPGGDAYTADFCFTVPECIATTCRHNYGEVAYTLNLILQRKSTFNKIFKQNIVVKNRLDLNTDTQLCERCTVGKELELSLPYTGFVPGQRIAYRLEACSKLSEYTKISCNLYQRLTFRSLLPVLHTKEVVTSLASDKCKIPSHTLGLLREGRLCIPFALPISSVYSEHLIGVSYYVEAVVRNGRNRKIQKLIVPITIGTVALESATPPPVEDNKNFARFCYDNFAATEGSLKVPFNSNEDPEIPHCQPQEHLKSNELQFRKNARRIFEQITLLPAQEIETHSRRFSNF